MALKFVGQFGEFMATGRRARGRGRLARSAPTFALAALGRLLAPRSKSAFAGWLATTAADRFTRISPKVLDHRKFWEAMHAVDPDALAEISTRLAVRMIEVFDLDTSSVALDMTNFATYIDTTNERAPIAQRGRRNRNAPTCG